MKLETVLNAHQTLKNVGLNIDGPTGMKLRGFRRKLDEHRADFDGEVNDEVKRKYGGRPPDPGTAEFVLYNGFLRTLLEADVDMPKAPFKLTPEQIVSLQSDRQLDHLIDVGLMDDPQPAEDRGTEDESA